jgi:hypothetical protein
MQRSSALLSFFRVNLRVKNQNPPPTRKVMTVLSETCHCVLSERSIQRLQRLAGRMTERPINFTRLLYTIDQALVKPKLPDAEAVCTNAGISSMEYSEKGRLSIIED